MTTTRKSSVANHVEHDNRTNSSSRVDQLRKLLAKPQGVEINIICKKFGWQPHTVRAAISRIRKSGSTITFERSKKSGRSRYRIDTSAASAANPAGSAKSPEMGDSK